MTLILTTKGRPREQTVRVLLDDGAEVPAVSLPLVQRLGIPRWTHPVPRVFRAWDGSETGQGLEYAGPVVLRHGEDHFTSLSLELSPLDEEVDVILPYWWLQRHQPQGFFQGPKFVTFKSDYCRQHCTSLTELGKVGRISAITADAPTGEIPEKFRKLAPLAASNPEQRLPQHQAWDHAIDLKPGVTLSWGPLYAMSGKELKFLRKWLDEMLEEGKIRPSKSSCSAPLFMVDKDASIEKKGTNEDNLRPVVDWRDLNGKTIPNRHPLPLINELQDRLERAKHYTKLDMKSGFNLIRVKEGDEWKTAFRCRYGLFEFTVMHFGMTNAPATFQSMMNAIFSDLIDVGVLVYVDDILIYAETEEEHDRLVLEVLKRLRENNLIINPKKCVWSQMQVEYLGYIISAEGIQMTKKKVDCITNWAAPTSLKECQSFVGFANFYRRFINNFSAIVRPLTSSLKVEKKEWKWTPSMKEAFTQLKVAFTTAPILAHHDPARQCIVETDASDFAIGAVVSQKQDDGKLHPVAFHSRKFTPAEMNYEVHDKELLAIVDCFMAWRRYLEGTEHTIEVFTDHHNLEYFTHAKVLNRRQARWAQLLSTYRFVIHYRPGSQNGKADVLSRLPQHRPEKGGDEDQPITTVLKGKHFAPKKGGYTVLSSVRLASIPVQAWESSFVEQVKSAAEHDQDYADMLKQPDKHHAIAEDLLYRHGVLRIPNHEPLKKEILHSEHDSVVAGHQGMERTLDLIRRNFWWPAMEEDVREYVRGCLECQCNKNPRHGVFGLLQPMEIKWKPWRSISMDFITSLPLSNGCDSIWVIVDMFTKMAHFIPLKVEGKKADDLIRIFAREYWRLHGVPSDIVSDRDSRFTGHLWEDFLKLVGIKSRMSTAFHPQTDGQTEIVNQTLETYLRAFVNYEMSNWYDLLPVAEFAYNNAKGASTKMTPFFANYGYHPAAHNPTELRTIARNPASRLYAHWMKEVHEEAIKNLQHARDRMKLWADKKRKEAPNFEKDQLVLLNARNIRTRRPTKKLDKKMLGPFQIVQMVSPSAAKLKLPPSWRIHDTFHVSLLEPFRTGSHGTPDVEQVLKDIGPVEPEEYQVEQIMDAMTVGEGVKYLVKWQGWPQRRHWTWEPYEHFTSEGSKGELTAYHLSHLDKPVDSRVLADIARGRA
jgi:hypothetical protein